MKELFTALLMAATMVISDQNKHSVPMKNLQTITTFDTTKFKSGYADVNGIKMYYEIYGEGMPLVLIHGGGSTIQTTFGRIIPKLATSGKLICVELQAHGRTSDRNSGLSFDRDADDIYELLKKLKIGKADFFGFSNGGTTALKVAIRHPEICKKVIAMSILLKRDGALPQFWEFMKNGTFDQMPQQYKDAFLAVTPNQSKLMTMYQKCSLRMTEFKDFSDEEIKSIQSPVLLINGDADVATSEHVVKMSKLIPDCNLAIVPGGHGEYIGEITTIGSNTNNVFSIPIIEKFLQDI